MILLYRPNFNAQFHGVAWRIFGWLKSTFNCVVHPRIALLLLSLFVITSQTACGFRHITQIENGGQSFEQVKVKQGTELDLSEFSHGDTMFVANDQGRALSSSPPRIKISLMEPTYTPISLGIPDFDFRFGWMFKTPDTSRPQKSVKLFSLKQVSLDEENFWREAGAFVLNEEHLVKGTVAARFRLLVANTGDAPFSGSLAVYDRLPNNLDFVAHKKAQKVYDAQLAKQILSVIPIVGMFTARMDRFQPILGSEMQLSPTFAASNRMLTYQTNIQLEPGEGLQIEFDAKLKLPRDEALIKARMQPPRRIDQ